MTNIIEIEGIGQVYADKLNSLGINTFAQYLETCKTKKGRAELAEKAGISEKLILTWANHADLARIKGIRGQYAELLEAAGVDTVPELAQRNAENLYKSMAAIKDAKGIVRKLPGADQVADWIEQAKKLPRILEY